MCYFCQYCRNISISKEFYQFCKHKLFVDSAAILCFNITAVQLDMTLNTALVHQGMVTVLRYILSILSSLLFYHGGLKRFVIALKSELLLRSMCTTNQNVYKMGLFSSLTVTSSNRHDTINARNLACVFYKFSLHNFQTEVFISKATSPLNSPDEMNTQCSLSIHFLLHCNSKFVC